MKNIDMYTDHELGEIYKANVGYDPFEDGITRDDVIELIEGIEVEQGPMNIPSNIFGKYYNPKPEYISHNFFPLGAVLYNVKNTMVFVYPSDIPNPDGNICAWYTGEPRPADLNSWLNDDHSTLGSGQCGTFAQVMKDLFDAN